MKITVHREGLLLACQQIAPALPTGTGFNPILSSCKLSAAAEGAASLVATDLEVGVRVSLPAVTVEEEGAALLPAAQLKALLAEAADEELTVETDPGGVFVRGAFAEYELPYEDPGAYPDWPEFAGDAIDLPETLGAMIGHVLYAVSQPRLDNTTKWLATMGVLWELDGQVRLVGTDGRQVSVSEAGAAASKAAPITPVKALRLLERNLGGGPARLIVRDNDVLWLAERATIYSRLVAGRFPTWKKILPRGKPPRRAVVAAGALLKAVRQALLSTDAESLGVIVAFAAGAATLRAHSNSRGRASVRLPLEYEGEPLELALDGGRVAEMLRTWPEAEKLTLEMTDAASLVVIRAPATAGRTCVTLPLHFEKKGEGK